jgi:hypothetical protein
MADIMAGNPSQFGRPAEPPEPVSVPPQPVPEPLDGVLGGIESPLNWTPEMLDKLH